MTREITKDKWIWMPHPAHFICSRDCQFFLATKVGKWIVSTVGEYLPDSRVRQIFADSRGIKIEGMGDVWDADYMKKIGFEDIGFDRKYETMVFRAVKTKSKECDACLYRIDVKVEYPADGYGSYNDASEAYKGHLKICNKVAKNQHEEA